MTKHFIKMTHIFSNMKNMQNTCITAIVISFLFFCVSSNGTTSDIDTEHVSSDSLSNPFGHLKNLRQVILTDENKALAVFASDEVHNIVSIDFKKEFLEVIVSCLENIVPPSLVNNSNEDYVIFRGDGMNSTFYSKTRNQPDHKRISSISIWNNQEIISVLPDLPGYLTYEHDFDKEESVFALYTDENKQIAKTSISFHLTHMTFRVLRLSADTMIILAQECNIREALLSKPLKENVIAFMIKIDTLEIIDTISFPGRYSLFNLSNPNEARALMHSGEYEGQEIVLSFGTPDNRRLEKEISDFSLNYGVYCWWLDDLCFVPSRIFPDLGILHPDQFRNIAPKENTASSTEKERKNLVLWDEAIVVINVHSNEIAMYQPSENLIYLWRYSREDGLIPVGMYEIGLDSIKRISP